jgi:hypothetical protein
MLRDIESLDEYLTKYGGMLGRQAAESLRPLHVPDRHMALGSSELLREPFDAQAHVITASVKALRRQKTLMLVAEMGTGKTLMAVATVHAHAGDRGYRALVFCPGQLTEKWAREIRETVPDADIQILESWRDVVRLYAERRPQCILARPQWYVIARDRAKLGSKWRAAYATRVTKDGRLIVCPACYQPPTNDKGLLITPEELTKKRQKCTNELCGQPLWTMTAEINRFEPARFIHKKLKGFFDYLVLDEVHEEKSADTAQGHAAGSLAAACGKVIALTGTLIGGLAEHIRPLLFRLSPATVVADRLAWHEAMRFSELYGRIETRITERSGGSGGDNRMSRGTSRTKTKCVRPGIMPSLFGRHLLDKAVFLSLGEVAANLPDLDEIVVPVEMDAELAPCYRTVEAELKSAIKSMIRRGDRRLLGAMLQTLLAYPDHPYGWDCVGYYDRAADGGRGVFIAVTRPDNLSSTIIRPKEDRLLELVEREVGHGRQCWVYVQMTDKRDVADRLCELLRRRGMRSDVLRATVPLSQRERWIAEHGKNADVIVSHPKLVETGLDLFDKRGNHNFATLVFYEMGYNPFTLRQASRRSWRIGQTEQCKVFYLYYAGTMQERAMALMGKKIAAAQALDGKFSTDGLAAMAGDDGGSMEMALAKSLAEQIEEGDAQRAWAKVGQVEPGRPGRYSEHNEFAADTVVDLFGQGRRLWQQFNRRRSPAERLILAS